MSISIFEWAVQLVLDCIVNMFLYFRAALDATGPAWSVIVSMFVAFLSFRFILVPLFGKTINLGAASDTVKKIASKSSNHSNTKGGGS